MRLCLELAEVQKITDKKTGTTVSLVKNPPKVVVDDESLVPSGYWRLAPPPPPQIDKTLLKAVLAETSVPGCHLEQSTRVSIK